MTAATAHTPTDFHRATAPAPRRFDPFGLFSGLRAYRFYTALEAKSDSQLARMGLERSTIAKAALDAAFDRA